jgi:predicted PhzF superfamily epimerase YddE/YHI9
VEVWIARDYMAIYESEEQVRALLPDFGLFCRLDRSGIIVTAPGLESDFVSRYFAPQEGIPEDPVTGSAHCTLAPYWAKRLGRSHLHAIQVSPRGGELWCNVQQDRVILSGYLAPGWEGAIEVSESATSELAGSTA